VNDAERLRHDPAMRWIVGGKATSGEVLGRREAGRRREMKPVRGDGEILWDAPATQIHHAEIGRRHNNVESDRLSSRLSSAIGLANAKANRACAERRAGASASDGWRVRSSL